jgi:signal transduction histidine kinase
MIEVRVTDTGCGIPEAIQRRVFDPFFTTKPVGKGTGQGLAITHAVVVTRHNGAITFESQVGRGTTFIVRLPISGGRSSGPIKMSATHRVPAAREVPV